MLFKEGFVDFLERVFLGEDAVTLGLELVEAVVSGLFVSWNSG